jgi:general nucleoside transport system permease protein
VLRLRGFASIAPLGRSLGAIAIAATFVALALSAFGLSPVETFFTLGGGAFGDWLALTDTLVKATPLLFAGLAVAVAFHGALWNIGADGQLLVGALAAAAIGPALGGFAHVTAVGLLLTMGTAAGALWGSVCGWLKARRQVNEVISTIMLNFAAGQMVSWAVHGPLIEASRVYPRSAPIAAQAQLYRYFPPSRLNLGMLAGALIAIAVYYWLVHLRRGLELRAMGQNPRAARFFGIRIGRLTIMGMALSGGLAGLGGAVQIAAITHRLYESFSPGWGYEGIAVALVARLNPLAVIPVSILFGALDNGSQALQRSRGVSAAMVQVIQGLVILTILALDRMAALSAQAPLGAAEPNKTPAEIG